VTGMYVVILGVFQIIWFMVVPRQLGSAKKVQPELSYGCCNHDGVALE